ncbi:glycoside hydrolase family 55 protein [Streptomyces sp. NPDC093591]|uniref:glycoside hydrolase family 55 protein n=1 Tax=Streptomyces sp. NPDC093591 TaxID=3366044 RepID=UPI003819C35D
MAFTPITFGTRRWDVPLNAALADLDSRLSQVSLNVRQEYGATGNGVTDDRAAIQSAIDAAAVAGGGIVYFPKGVYRISDSLVLKTGVTLQGAHSIAWPNRFTTPLCSIRPMFTFAGECAISILGDDITGAPGVEGNVRVFDIDIDGSAINGGSVSGIHAQGHVLDVVIARVSIKQFSHNGIHTNVGDGTQPPHDWFMDSVVAYNNGGYGFSMSMTDGYIRNCIAAANGGDGWLMGPFGSLTFDSCQALFNTGHGLNIGGGTQVGNLTVTGFLTDRNGQDGIHLGSSTGTGSPPFVLAGITCNRDGRNGNAGGGGFAGLRVQGCANPIVINGLVVNTGVDDDATGTNSPQYGARFSTAAYVQVNGGYVHGNTTGWQDDGDNTILRRLNVDEATGSKTAPTFVYGTGPSTAALGWLLPNAATAPATPATGAVTYGGTSRAIVKNSSGLNGTIPVGALGLTTTVTVTNTVAETVLHTLTVPGSDASAGSVYEICAWGNADWPVTTVPTITLRLRVGGLAGDVLATVVITCPSTAGTAAGWRADGKVLLTSVGAAANWRGNLLVADSIATALSSNPIAVSDSNAGATRSSTSTQDLVITGQWSAAAAANVLRCTGAHAMRAR